MKGNALNSTIIAKNQESAYKLLCELFNARFETDIDNLEISKRIEIVKVGTAVKEALTEAVISLTYNSISLLKDEIPKEDENED